MKNAYTAADLAAVLGVSKTLFWGEMMKKLSALALVLAGAFLAGCQTQPVGQSIGAPPELSVRAKVTQPQEKIVAYFSKTWRASAKPVTDGYFRKLYGKTADGHYIVQDFYQDSGAKHTDPFEVIKEAGLTVWGTRYVTGPFVRYTRNGSKRAMSTYENGKRKGPIEIYYPNGKLKYRDESGPTGGRMASFYDDNGSKIIAMTGKRGGDLERFQGWHPNGKPALDAVMDGKKLLIKGWDETGQALPEASAMLQFFAFSEVLQKMIGEDIGGGWMNGL